MLRIDNIQKSFGGVRAIAGSNFEVEKGKVTALIGPNGAGKTTLFNIITGQLRADSGSVLFHDQDITNKKTHEIARLGLSRTFQQVRLFRHLSIADHLMMVQDHKDTALFANTFGSQKGPPVSSQEILDRFGIDRAPETLVSELSYGQRKLLDIAMALEMTHQLLLFDEPVAGVNQVIQDRIEALLLELKKTGETMLIIDHDMAFVRRLADHVIVLDAGVVLTQGDPDTVLQDPRVLEAYLGE